MIDPVALVVVGLLAGTAAGFFGIGGGVVVVPLLVAVGVPVKIAVGVSAMQMVASSIFGSVVNFRRGHFNPKAAWPFGVGGVAGGIVGGTLLTIVPDRAVLWFFVGVLLFALVRVWMTPPHGKEHTVRSLPLAMLAGASIGVFSGLLGVGGSFLLIPVLVGFFGYGIKEAIGMGLFYVMFPSISAFSTLAFHGYVDYMAGVSVAVGSLIGVRFGIFLGEKTGAGRHKMLVVVLYVALLALVMEKIIAGVSA